jgi:hypothetical protein
MLRIQPLTFTITNQVLTNGLHHQNMSNVGNDFISHVIKLQKNSWLNLFND